jgi:hypothetical protein
LFAADDVTIGAPLPRQLRAFLRIGVSSIRDEKEGHKDCLQNNGSSD